MPQKDKIIDLRSQLLANGYTPLPNKDKACYMTGWPSVKVSEKEIKRWARMRAYQATGIRVENGLCVIDVDISTAVAEDVAEAMLTTLPEDMQPERLERNSGGYKFAWFVRTDELFNRIHTRRWTAPGQTADDDTHCVEIFGGASARQFGCFGPHSHDDSGKVLKTYQWAEESPLDVPMGALPILTKKQLFAMVDAAERELKRIGYTPMESTERGEGSSKPVYDLTEDMKFDMQDGRRLSLAELQEIVKYQENVDLRCSASWMEGPTAKNTRRCKVVKSHTGHVGIWESAEGVTHYPEAIKPVDPKEMLDRVDELAREQSAKRLGKLNANDDHISGCAKILNTYAFIPSENKPVISLWDPDPNKAMTIQNFKIMMQPYCGVEVGPRGGEKKINPVDVWAGHHDKVVASAVVLRPDRERPTFEEFGERFINSYRTPMLGSSEGGTAQGGIDLLEQLLPDDEELDWFIKWLAYKWKNPHVPGPGVIMVARQFGTGRSTLGTLISKMFGERYVKNVAFDIFAGKNYQSQYTDWGLNALFAVVNESSTSGDISSYKSKHDVYEHLKEIVDPRPTKRTYVVSGRNNVEAMSCTSYLILTNNPDALPLPEDDRRFTVLSNGEKREPEFWYYVNAWMDKPANIAAFVEWLCEEDLNDYDPFAPPLFTTAKEDMTEFNRTPLDKLLSDVLDEFPDYLVYEQIVRRMSELELKRGVNLPGNWKDIVGRELNKRCRRVRYKTNNRKFKPSINGNKYEVLTQFKEYEFMDGDAEKIRKILIKTCNVF